METTQTLSKKPKLGLKATARSCVALIIFLVWPFKSSKDALLSFSPSGLISNPMQRWLFFASMEFFNFLLNEIMVEFTSIILIPQKMINKKKMN